MRANPEREKIDHDDRCDTIPMDGLGQHRPDHHKRQHHPGVGEKEQTDRHAKAQWPEGGYEPFAQSLGLFHLRAMVSLIARNEECKT